MKKLIFIVLIINSFVFARENVDVRVSQNGIGVDTLIGAAIGATLGHQIGKGSGNAVATVVGGLIGASVANNSRGNYSNYNTSTYVGYSNYSYEPRYYPKHHRHYREFYEPRRYMYRDYPRRGHYRR